MQPPPPQAPVGVSSEASTQARCQRDFFYKSNGVLTPSAAERLSSSCFQSSIALPLRAPGQPCCTTSLSFIAPRPGSWL